MVSDKSLIVPSRILDERPWVLTLPLDELSFMDCGGVFLPPKSFPKILGISNHLHEILALRTLSRIAGYRRPRPLSLFGL